MGTEHERVVYRSGLAKAQLVAQLVTALVGAGLVIGVADGGGPGKVLLSLAVGVAWAYVAGYRLTWRPCVVSDPDGVTIVGAFGERSFPWSELWTFEGGRVLHVVTNDGVRYTAGAVQSASAALVARRAGYADRVAQALQDRLDAQHAGGTGAGDGDD